MLLDVWRQSEISLLVFTFACFHVFKFSDLHVFIINLKT